jgi:hypothetical protein
MRMSKAFIAAVPLALALVAAVVVPLALSAAAGTFGFTSWPTSPAAPPRDNAVVIEQPLELSARSRSVERSRRPVVRDDADRARGSAHGALVAQVDRGAYQETSKPPSGDTGARRPGRDAGTTPRSTGDGAPGTVVEETPSGHTPAPPEAPAPSAGSPVPDTVAVVPVPPTGADPQGGVAARPAAPTGTAEDPPAERTDDDPAEDDSSGDGRGRPAWLLPDLLGHRGDGDRHGGGRGRGRGN